MSKGGLACDKVRGKWGYAEGLGRQQKQSAREKSEVPAGERRGCNKTDKEAA